MTDATPIPESEVDALLAPFGGAEAVYAADAALRENRKYLDEHRAELKRLYPEEWIVMPAAASWRTPARQTRPAHGPRTGRVDGRRVRAAHPDRGTRLDAAGAPLPVLSVSGYYSAAA